MENACDAVPRDPLFVVLDSRMAAPGMGSHAVVLAFYAEFYRQFMGRQEPMAAFDIDSSAWVFFRLG
jgi:hypothetical protein